MDRHRIDQWLKLVCLFKHRTEATEACRGGHVKLNGQRVKPAAVVREGDLIEFLQGDRLRRVVVSVLPGKQASKDSAKTMYLDESPPVVKVPVEMTVFRERGAGRPTKRDRREMEKWRR
ncbi:MAG TPA: S4 domain-containing protein [Thermoanaerobaculia bacterium]|nr:S4 domain-containing protein [Thermoanaerobaculia bacterium]